MAKQVQDVAYVHSRSTLDETNTREHRQENIEMIRNQITRRAFLAFGALFAAIAFIAASQAATAQLKCACDYVTLRVDKELQCKFEICYQKSPDGPTICYTIEPGQVERIPCFPGQGISLVRCDGAHIDLSLDPVARCRDIKFAPDCCARVCVSLDEKGCAVIDVNAVPCPDEGC